MTLILIVEDELDIANTVARYLQADGHSTQILDQGTGVVEWVRQNHPALIVLDVMLPGVDGITLCRELRRFTALPIIMTTARVEENNRLEGFDSGADDYLCKPYSARELVARIKALLRRAAVETAKSSLLILNEDAFEACINGQCVAFTAIEFRLLELLARHPGRLYSRDRIIDQVYRDYRIVSDRTVDSHIRNLRHKLKPLGMDKAIHSVYGEGYKYDPPTDT